MASEAPANEGDAPGFWTWPKLCGVVVAVWVVAGLAPFLVAPPLMKWAGVDPAQTGTFGDTFGVVNSLFSALGVAGVAYALILQTREQRDSRIEAEATKDHAEQLQMLSVLVAGRSALLQADQMTAHDTFLLTLFAIKEKAGDEQIDQTKKVLADAYKNVADARSEISKLVGYADSNYTWDETYKFISDRLDSIAKTVRSDYQAEQDDVR